MRKENLDDSFFKKSYVEINACFCSQFSIGKKDVFAVSGIISRTEGPQRGIFVGSRVLAFTSNKNPEQSIMTLRMPSTRVFPVPQGVKLKAAAAVARYIMGINALRECAAPLCSNYAITRNDENLQELMKAMGYISTSIADADLIIDTDGSCDDFVKAGVHLLKWRQKVEGEQSVPGADWELFQDEECRQVKYSEAYIATRVADNLKTYFNLIADCRLSPNMSDVIVLGEEPQIVMRSVKRDFSLFHPYEALLANRRKPMVAVCVVGRRSQFDERITEQMDSLIGFEHTTHRMMKDTLKLGYPDGSIADVLLSDSDTEYIELHFDGLTITRVNGTVSKY